MLVVSIVSHGHGPQVQALLCQMAALPGLQPVRVVLTLNQPEVGLTGLEQQPWPFELVVHANAQEQGFGANHNQAFSLYAEPLETADEALFFAVLNPDVTLHDNPWPALLQALTPLDAGCAWPCQVDAWGQAQDHERTLPTPASIAARALWMVGRRLRLARHTPPGRADGAPDWGNAAFWLVRASVWRLLGGFDTRYFMYGEDVDFCLRLQLAGWQLVRASTRVTHVAQRNSRRNWKHFSWHVRSLLRLWRSPVYADYRRWKTINHLLK